MKYKGETCSKCGVTFEENDDIVVCPQCGSPHHRKCCETADACANAEKHGEGFKWSPVNAVKNKGGFRSAISCPHCNSVIESGLTVCPHCGEAIDENDVRDESSAQSIAFKRLFGIERTDKINGAPAEELLYFIRSNAFYYFPLFKHIAETGKKVSFNLLCFIFPPIYFANRRMWLWAILTAVFSVILALPLSVSYLADMSMTDSAYAFFSSSVVDALSANSGILNKAIQICNIVDFAMRFLLCLFGNWLYYRFATSSVRKIRESKGGIAPTPDELRSAGGVRIINSVLIVLITCAMTFIAMMISQTLLETLLVKV